MAPPAPLPDPYVSARLHEAIRRADFDEVGRLIAAHAPEALASGYDERGCPPLVAAIFDGREPIAAMLVRHGVGIEDPVREEGSYPLHFAAVLGEVDMIAMLAAAGARIDIEDQDGDTPLHWAVRAKQYGAARTLLRLGADPHKQGRFTGLSPMQLAMFLGMPDFEKLLGSAL